MSDEPQCCHGADAGASFHMVSSMFRQDGDEFLTQATTTPIGVIATGDFSTSL